MDAATSLPSSFVHRLAAFPPPTLVDVRRQPAFAANPDVIPGDVRRPPEAVDALGRDARALAPGRRVLRARP